MFVCGGGTCLCGGGVCVCVWVYVMCGCVVGTAVDSWLCSLFSTSVGETKLLEHLLFLLPLNLLTC